MTTTVHKNLTGSDLHEPKGADTALSGQVYVSNGAGSGVWTTASSVITNTAFTTGDLKPTHKVTADTSWIMWTDGTIGDSSSGATIRANADTAALFALYWNNYSNSLCAVSGGRGASAVLDYAAHKTIALPKVEGRGLGVAGAGSGLTARTTGSTVGAESVSLSNSNLPNIQLTFTGTAGGVSVNSQGGVLSGAIFNNNVGFAGGSNVFAAITHDSASSTSVNSTGSFTPVGTISPFGGNIPHDNMSPTSYINVMIKL